MSSPWRWSLVCALALAIGGCSGDNTPASPDAQTVPDLPDYVQAFDERVRDLLRETHAELLADPMDAERWMKLGMVFEAHSEAGQAEACYLRAIELNAERAQWWYRLAMARESADKVEGTIEALDRVIELDPGYGPAHWRRGGWKLEMGDTAEARKCFERALSIDSGDPAALLGLVQVQIWSGENEAAVAALEGSALLEGRNGAWAKRQLGTAYQRLGRLEEARALIASTRDAKPHFDDPWKAEINRLRRGMAAVNRQARDMIAAGQARAALPMLENAHDQEPNHIPILRTLGAAYAAAGEGQKALEALRAAVLLDPDNVELQVDAGWARALGGDIPGALDDADAILASDPTCAKAHALRTQLLLDLARPQEAVDAFRLAMEHGHRDPAMLVNIGKTLLQLGKLEEAQASFVRAAGQDPALQSAWIGQVICGLDLGQLDAAGEALTRAEELSDAQGTEDAAMLAQIRTQLNAERAASAPK